MYRFLSFFTGVLFLSVLIGCSTPSTPAAPAATPTLQPVHLATSTPQLATPISSLQPSPTSPPIPTITPTSIPTVLPTMPPTIAAAKSGWTQITAVNSGPAPRYDHSALVDPVRQNLIVFGGR